MIDGDPVDERALRFLLGMIEPPGKVTRVGLEALLAEVVDVVCTLGVDGVAVLLLDAGDRLRVALSTDDFVADLTTGPVGPAAGTPVDVQALRSGPTVVLADVAVGPEHPALRERLRDSAVRAVLLSPIRVGGEVAGSLGAVMHAPHEWTSTERRTTDACADVVGMALRLSRGMGTEPE